jgi:hypothetical protein
MAAALVIVDQSPTGASLQRRRLQLVSHRVALRDIIEARVRAEVADHNAQPPTTFRGLVQPTDTEATLNGYAFRKPRRIDPDVQVAKALAAFEANGFFVLARDRQIEDLDELIDVEDGLEVAFVKLLPLVGG